MGPQALRMTPCVIVTVDAVVSAGFPSPAADYSEGRVDLGEVLAPHPSATFTLRVSGHSMTSAGIHDGDLAIVDRSLTARHDDVVVAVLDGELLCKRLVTRGGRTLLAADWAMVTIPSTNSHIAPFGPTLLSGGCSFGYPDNPRWRNSFRL